MFSPSIILKLPEVKKMTNVWEFGGGSYTPHQVDPTICEYIDQTRLQ